MYRSGTTAIARLLAGENKIAFSSDPIRPFFNWYRSILQKDIGYTDIDDYIDLKYANLLFQLNSKKKI